MSHGGAAASIAADSPSTECQEASPTSDLARRLGLLDSTLLVVGIVIGSGIFLTTGLIAVDLPSPKWILAAWVIGGIITLTGALTFAELGAALPEAGGQYVYLREAFGVLPAFLFGWIVLLVYQTGAVAAVAAACATYLTHFFPALSQAVPIPGGRSFPSIPLERFVAVSIIVGLTAANVRGLKLGSGIQNLSTIAKVVGLIVFSGALLWQGANARTGSLFTSTSVTPEGLLGGIALAQVAVLWTFDGWHNLNFSAGEIRRPSRNIPGSLILGTLAVAALYVVVNAGYLSVLPMDEVQGELRIAERASLRAFGTLGAHLVSLLIILSTAAAVNGVILTGARVYFAMARDGVFFRSVGAVHPRYNSPHVALTLHGTWACVLVLTGSYAQLFTFVTFAALLLYVAAALAVFRLRRTRPELHRPYRVPGYPITPLVFMGSTVLLAANTLVSRPLESLAGLAVIGVGVPAYFLFFRPSGSSGNLDQTFRE